MSVKKTMEELHGSRHGAKTDIAVSQAHLAFFQRLGMSLWKLLPMSWSATVGSWASGIFPVDSKRAKELV